MDMLEAKSEAAWKAEESRRDELIREWNRRFAVGTMIREKSYKLVNTPQVTVDVEFDGPTTSKAYADGTTAVIDVKGHTRVSLHREFVSIGWNGSHRW